MRFHNKAFLKILAIALILNGFIFSSCNRYYDPEYKPSFIEHFGFDSFPALAKYTFYIDHYGHRIFNKDSFPFKTRIDTVFPCIKAVSTNGEIFINGEAWEAKKVVDFRQGPFTLTNTSEDGKFTSSYTLDVNIHQVDPDSLQMSLICRDFIKGQEDFKVLKVEDGFIVFFMNDGKLQSQHSADGRIWEDIAASSLPAEPDVNTLTLLGNRFFFNADGVLYSSRSDLQEWAPVLSDMRIINLLEALPGRRFLTQDALAAIIEDTEGVWRFARIEWDNATSQAVIQAGEAVPEDFPVRYAAIAGNKTVTDVHFLVLVGGENREGLALNDVWSTMDGLYWTRISDDFDPVCYSSHASAFYYDNSLFLFGGQQNVNGQIFRDNSLYISTNHGIEWKVADERLHFLELSSQATHQQILSDDRYIWIFGGNPGEIWKAHINRILF